MSRQDKLIYSTQRDSMSSRYVYRLPVKLDSYVRFPNSPQHKGPFLYAEDIAVPNPEETETIVYAPQTGTIWTGVLMHSKWGTTEEYKFYLNWINILVGKKEFYELAHVAPLPGKILRPGDIVEKGEPILKTALNGIITTTDGIPDSHLHVLVGRWLNRNKTSFESLKIRWEDS